LRWFSRYLDEGKGVSLLRAQLAPRRAVRTAGGTTGGSGQAPHRTGAI